MLEVNTTVTPQFMNIIGTERLFVSPFVHKSKLRSPLPISQCMKTGVQVLTASHSQVYNYVD